MFARPAGAGKTVLSVALGRAAVDTGHRVYFTTAAKLAACSPPAAGMVPSERAISAPTKAAPRACVDGPGDEIRAMEDLACSPPARGWSRRRRPDGQPLGSV
ncbi:ATP-binding protein [Streptomyces sp. NPDC097704]|uniref:ATP-binding protein n=1 Tax=Streptomyces sp. NPDC097704 TaxID=3157101 RepID=UPI003316F91B